MKIDLRIYPVKYIFMHITAINKAHNFPYLLTNISSQPTPLLSPFPRVFKQPPKIKNEK